MPEAFSEIVPLIVAGIIFLGILRLITEALESGQIFQPKYRAVPLLTKAEQAAWRALRHYISPPLHLCAKVRLADIIKPVKDEDGKAGRAALNKVWAKHIDFVVFDPRYGRVILAIEVDDSSHLRADRKKRDAFVDAALNAAGIPIDHIPLGKGSFAQAQVRLKSFFQEGDPSVLRRAS